MRILHTADWHLNSVLGRVPRNGDVRRSLEQIRGYLAEHAVDVLVVAGDVIEKNSTSGQVRDAVHIIKEVFLPFLQQGGTMVVISGNHDDDELFDALRLALDLSPTGAPRTDGLDPSGRLYLAPNPGILRLADRQGFVVQFVLMPYPEADVYLRGDNVRYSSLADKHQKVQAKFNEMLDILRGRVLQQHPTVLVSHVHVQGAQAHSLYKLSPADDVIFAQGDIPDYWAYVAYGHIHRAQLAKPGAEHVRYSGSIERMDMGERDDDKQVVLVEIGPGVRTYRPLPLDVAPMYAITIDDPDTQIATLAERYPDATRALVNYTLHYDPARHNRDELCREIEAIFPRVCGHDVRPVSGGGMPLKRFEAQSLHDVTGNVRVYLTKCLQNHRDQADLMALAEEVLSEEGGR